MTFEMSINNVWLSSDPVFYRFPTGSSSGIDLLSEGGSIAPCRPAALLCYAITSPRTSSFVAFNGVPFAPTHAAGGQKQRRRAVRGAAVRAHTCSPGAGRPQPPHRSPFASRSHDDLPGPAPLAICPTDARAVL